MNIFHYVTSFILSLSASIIAGGVVKLFFLRRVDCDLICERSSIIYYTCAGLIPRKRLQVLNYRSDNTNFFTKFPTKKKDHL